MVAGLTTTNDPESMRREDLFDGFSSRQLLQDQFHRDPGPAITGLPIMTDGSDRIRSLFTFTMVHRRSRAEPGAEEAAAGAGGLEGRGGGGVGGVHILLDHGPAVIVDGAQRVEERRKADQTFA